MLDPRCWILDIACSIFDTGYRFVDIPDAGCWIKVANISDRSAGIDRDMSLKLADPVSSIKHRVSRIQHLAPLPEITLSLAVSLKPSA